MASASLNLLDHLDVVEAFAPAVPSSADPNFINLALARQVGVLIHTKNATGVTGAKITLKQAKDDAGDGEKDLEFVTYFEKADAGNGSGHWLLKRATGNTFTAGAASNKNAVYFIPVSPASLDINEDFTHLRVGIGNATEQTVTALYLTEPKYAGDPEGFPSSG